MLSSEFLVIAMSVLVLEPSYIAGRDPYNDFDLQNSNDHVSLNSLSNKVCSLANES